LTMKERYGGGILRGEVPELGFFEGVGFLS
jgi:hypothetical protein